MKKNKPSWLIVHNTGGIGSDPNFDTSNQTFEQINAFHEQNPNINLGYPSSLGYYIGYHYFIAKDGTVTQGRADTDEGAHTKGYNMKSLGICLAGNFDVFFPTSAQKESLKNLLLKKMAEYDIAVDHIVPHRTFCGIPPYKSCYGNNLSDTWAQELVKNQ